MSAGARRALAAAAALAVAAGCASSARREADSRLVDGDAAGAAVAYESLLSAPLGPVGEDLVLLRAATAHALANFERGDFARSRELLVTLETRYPASPHRPTAGLLRQLLERQEAQAEGLAAARASADELLARTRRQRQRQEGDAAGASEPDIDRLRESLAELERQLARQQSEARAREAELVKLRREIEMLKAIDLDRGAPPPG